MDLSEKILDAREKRYNFTMNLIHEYRQPVLCAKINYPGTDKNTTQAEFAFKELKAVVKKAFDGDAEFSCTLEGADGSSFLIVLPSGAEAAKMKAIEIEETHPLGRIFDIDIYDLKGAPIDRSAVGKDPRACVVCGKPARNCMRSGSHRLEEVLDAIHGCIDRELQEEDVEKKASRIAEAALLGMLYEISAFPSPGLVSPFSNGAHKDMDYFTFLKSTAAISSVMRDCAIIGITKEEALLAKIRKIGLTAEKRMFAVTEGVNTQKGLLFLAGVVCCAAGSCIREGKIVDRKNISDCCKDICKGIVENELHGMKQLKKTHSSVKATHLSNGEKLFLNHGALGVRGEAAGGLPTVIETGLPYLEIALKAGLSINDALVNSLIGIMSVLEDTTVLNRAGMEGIRIMHSVAKEALDLGGMNSMEGRAFIETMDQKFIQNNISPGGAADLLAVTVMIYELEKIFT